jgi:hypothetical protein
MSRMDYEKDVNGTKYILSHSNWLTGIQVDSLYVDLKKDGNKFHEEITAKASFIQDLSFCCLSEHDELYFGSKIIDLEIRKTNDEISIEESARSNLANYLTPEDDPYPHGLNDCINTGFSHLSIYAGRTNCILVLEDNIFERLLSLIKNNSLRSFSFAPKYLSLYTKGSTHQGHITDKNQSFYIIKSEGQLYPNSTFGTLSDLNITTNDWSFEHADAKTISDNLLISTETQKQISSDLIFLSYLILYGFMATIILLIIMIIF